MRGLSLIATNNTSPLHTDRRTVEDSPVSTAGTTGRRCVLFKQPLGKGHVSRPSHPAGQAAQRGTKPGAHLHGGDVFLNLPSLLVYQQAVFEDLGGGTGIQQSESQEGTTGEWIAALVLVDDKQALKRDIVML